MVENFLAFLAQLESTFSVSNPTGLVTLFLLAIITDIGVPVPFVLDTILILTSFHSGPFSWPVLIIILILFIGRQIGSGLLYMLSRYVGPRFIEWLKVHVPMLGCRLGSFKSRLSSCTSIARVPGRLTPGLLQITSVTAGSLRVSYLDFVLGVAFSSIIYDGILVLLGFIARSSPRAADMNFTVWLLIALIIVICILWPLIFVFIRRNDKRNCAPEDEKKTART